MDGVQKRIAMEAASMVGGLRFVRNMGERRYGAVSMLNPIRKLYSATVLGQLAQYPVTSLVGSIG